MFFWFFFFFFSIPFVISTNDAKDLSITKYYQIGCLVLQSDKQFLVNHIQENSLLPYQTFSSPLMTIELCFRLCRQLIILLDNNQTHCICLYTINKLYEFNKYLGEFKSMNNCSIHDVQVYSLTKDIQILPPSLLSSTSDDWSLNGCYQLHDITSVHVDVRLTGVDFPQAIQLCRNHCQRTRQSNSYFLSREKCCYCAPIKFSQTIETSALRTPLIHCSFLPHICQAFSQSCENLHAEINANTLVKIDIHQHCRSNDQTSFMFDSMLYMCLKRVVLSVRMTIPMINDAQQCLPIVIQTEQQWLYFSQSLWITTLTKTFLSIDQNSTYIFNHLFKSTNRTLLANKDCIAAKRINGTYTWYDLIQCSEAQSPGEVLCAQKPFPSMISHEDKFKRIQHNESELLNNEILSCPLEFILFNKKCYYIHVSLTYTIHDSERLCHEQHSDSTLVKYDSHETKNINATNFLGRTFHDILLEWFYYLLEKKLMTQPNRKHRIQLLLGVQNNSNDCVSRYFSRSAGGFEVRRRCDIGGYPVCQLEPIRSLIKPTNEMMNHSSIELTTKSSILVLNSTNLLILSNETTGSICENCTTNISRADEDPAHNDTQINSSSNHDASLVAPIKSSQKTKYQPLILILSSLVLGLTILFIGIGLVIWQHRRKCHSYSTRNVTGGGRRIKRSSTTVTTGDVPNTPTILYTPFKPPRVSILETDALLSLDHLLSDHDSIELLPTTKVVVQEIHH